MADLFRDKNFQHAQKVHYQGALVLLLLRVTFFGECLGTPKARERAPVSPLNYVYNTQEALVI